VLFVKTQPDAGEHVSSVHGLVSSQVIVDPRQTPELQ
jgi:hypothetical protein